jgi:hypothetical protein
MSVGVDNATDIQKNNYYENYKDKEGGTDDKGLAITD